jgi:hypothetical protein
MKVRNWWSFISTTPICPHGMHRGNVTFVLTCLFRTIKVNSMNFQWNHYLEFSVGISVHPCTGTEVLYRLYGPWGGGRGIALPFLDDGTRRGWGVSVTPWPLFTPGKDLVPIVQEAGWTPGPVWTGVENLAPTGIRSPDRPAHSQWLYRLCYPAHGYSSGIKVLKKI